MNTPSVLYRRPPGVEGVELLRLSDPDFNFAPHMHDTYVLWFNGQGGECVSLGGCSDILQPDSFGVAAPGEIHANYAVTERRTLESLYVSTEAVDRVARAGGCANGVFRSRLQRDRHSRFLLARLHAVLMQTDDAFLAQETFSHTFSTLLERHGEDPFDLDARPDQSRVHLARSIMRDRFAESLDLDGLAAECGCTAPHLIRIFKRETGITPHAYLMEQRLARAKDLLAAARPISDIALDTGFTDQSHLTRRFAARFGLTPARYRQQVRS